MKTREEAERILQACEEENRDIYRAIDEVALYNTEKVLAGFRDHHVAERHLQGGEE